MTSGTLGGHAEGAGVGDDGAAGVGKAGLEFAGDGGVEGGKDDLGCVRGAPSGSAGETVMRAMRSGSGVSSRHLAASP